MLKNNAYLKGLQEDYQKTWDETNDVSNSIKVLLSAWQECVKTNSDLIYIHNCFDTIYKDDVYEFVHHLRLAGIQDFTVSAKRIESEALHYFLQWNNVSYKVHAWQYHKSRETFNGEDETELLYTITIFDS